MDADANAGGAKSDNANSLPEDAELNVTEPEDSLPPLTMADLPGALQNACSAAGWSALTPVQSLGLPYLLAGRDIMVQSRTGSGKTGCYLLPMLHILDSGILQPQALVLAPTRELALQVEREAQTLFSASGLKACAIYGGVGYGKQLQALREGVHVVVGTPGRILDHLISGALSMQALRMLVFDEADRMLSIGFFPDMLQIARFLPKERQTTLFSATYPPHVLRLAETFMRKPQFLSLSRKEVHVAEVEHMFCQVRPMDKDRALVRLLETENPSSAIIFCNTRSDVSYVAGVLQGFGYRAEELSSELSQKKREAVLARVRSGEAQYLVATDVAARGIDIPEISHVFLYAPPEDHEGYIHRAGRTGRAGAAGTVISLVDVMQKMELERIARHYKIKLRELPLPTDDDVAKTVCQRLEAILAGRLRRLTGLERMRASRYLPLARELAEASAEGDENNLAILAMLLDDCHRQSLNESRLPAENAVPASAGAQKKAGGRKRRSGRRKSSNKAE